MRIFSEKTPLTEQQAKALAYWWGGDYYQSMPHVAVGARGKPPDFSYQVTFKAFFSVAAGFSLRLHRRDACATILNAKWYHPQFLGKLSKLNILSSKGR